MFRYVFSKDFSYHHRTYKNTYDIQNYKWSERNSQLLGDKISLLHVDNIRIHRRSIDRSADNTLCTHANHAWSTEFRPGTLRPAPTLVEMWKMFPTKTQYVSIIFFLHTTSTEAGFHFKRNWTYIQFQSSKEKQNKTGKLLQKKKKNKWRWIYPSRGR